MKVLHVLFLSLLISNMALGQYGGSDYGGGMGYGDQGQSGYGDQQMDPNQPKKTGTGLDRKGLMDPMDVMAPTKLSDIEKCKTKCNMAFIQCYRQTTDRGKCYQTQQECLEKCGGDEESTPEFTSPPGGGQLDF